MAYQAFLEALLVNNDNNSSPLALPFEWVLKKVLGPTLDVFGKDLAQLYGIGRDKILGAAKDKIPDLGDGKIANLRVARDVLWNGAFSNDEICAEYFGGILATSRSKDGNDDNAVPFVDVVKSMSSSQLRLHYYLYHSLAKSLIERGEKTNVFELPEKEEIYIPNVVARSDIDLEALLRLDLVMSYRYDRIMIGDRVLPYCSAHPSRFGIMLYAAAHNKLDWWQAYGLKKFGDFQEVKAPKLFGHSLAELKNKAEMLSRSSCE